MSKLQKVSEKFEGNLTTIKSKSKQLYEDFKKSLKELEDANKENKKKSTAIKELEREISRQQDEISAYKEKISTLKQSELELSYYKSSLKSITSQSLNNEMWVNQHH